MSLIISVYSQTAFQEFHLPALENADYNIVLERQWFHIRETLTVPLDVMDGKWKLRQGCGFRIGKLQGADRDDILRNQTTCALETANHELLYLLVKEVRSPFHAWEKFNLREISEPITIGRGSGNVIDYNFGLNMVSRNHAQLVHRPDGWIVFNQSGNVTYVNDQLLRKEESVRLNFGDNLNILGLHIVYLGQMIALNTDNPAISVNRRILRSIRKDDPCSAVAETDGLQGTFSGKVVYHRSPRSNEHLDQGEIEIETPPELEIPPEQSMLSAIGPAATMTLPMLLGYSLMLASSSRSGIYMYSGLVMSVSSAFLGVFWAVNNIRARKKELADKKQLRFSSYRNYLLGKTDEIRTVYENSSRILTEKYPEAAVCVRYDGNGEQLWSRNRSHSDFLVHRLGTGDIPFQMEIRIPQKKFRLLEDELVNQPSEIRNNYRTLYHVPVTVDLAAHRLIGVIGGRGKRGAYEILKTLSTQIIANNCYTDVKLVYIYNGNSKEEETVHSFAKWIPHVWSADRRMRYLVSGNDDAQDVFFKLNNLFRARTEEAGKFHTEKMIPNPYYVVFVSDPKILEGEILAKYLFDGSNVLGVTTILLCETYAELPNSCEYIIENDSLFTGMYHVTDQESEKIRVEFDRVGSSALNQFAEKTANLQVQEISSGGDIPSAITFFDMYQVNRPEDFPVREWWAKNKIYENIRGLLGQKAGGRSCYLDVHEKFHGPHGLIAGTTGSGKSETLQTYIMSLALHYSPDDVGFFIIDYKGGGMANLFNGLPHMIGQISNLSGNQVQRAMISIKSENRRRQRIFTENGVNNINAYTKLYKAGEASVPVPHLFIIIDEFAELKREQPDFMKELISVAQVGRSLGVHLILATQKPSGTVDDNIWSNSRFRLCLRVQDKQDSMDMLHKPDAAYITSAGRGYLQVGSDEVYEEFQSGYSGAIYEEDLPDVETDTVRLLRLNGTVDMTGSMARVSLKNHVQKIWISRLLTVLNRVLQDSGIDFRNFADEEQMNLLCGLFYRGLEEQNIEYPENKYNTERLKDLIGLFFSALEAGVRDRAEYVIDQAGKKRIRLPQQKEKTQLDAVKEYLAKEALRNGYTYKQLLWLPVLKEYLYLANLGVHFAPKTADQMGHDLSIPVMIGQFDDPANQSQPPFVLDLAACGNLAVYGSVTSGKSTLLQTICYQLVFGYHPEVVQIFCLDFSNNKLMAFEQAPHVRGIYGEYDADRLQSLFTSLSEELEERKQKLRGGSFSQYVQRNGMAFPAVFVLIDNFGTLSEKTEHHYDNDLIRLSREGINNGIYMIVTGGGVGMNEVIGRVADNLKTVLCLQLKDRYVYQDVMHTMKIDVIPEAGVRGRGLAGYEGRVLEFQTALAVEEENDYLRMEQIQRECEELSGRYGNEFAAGKTRKIPANPRWTDFADDPRLLQMTENPEVLPAGYDLKTADLWGISLKDSPCFGIYGAPESGKTNFMRICLESALLKQGTTVVIDSDTDPVLPEYSDAQNVTYIDTQKKLFSFLQPGFLSEFTSRNRVKKEVFETEENWDLVFEKLSQKEPYFIFLADFAAFVRFIEECAEKEFGAARLPAIIESYMKAGKCHNIIFIAEISAEIREQLLGSPIFNAFVRWHKGIHFGGNVSENVNLQFTYMSYQEKNAKEKPGIGALSADVGEIPSAEKVIIPLWVKD